MDGCGTYLNVDGDGGVKVLEASQRPASGGFLTESGFLPKGLMGSPLSLFLGREGGRRFLLAVGGSGGGSVKEAGDVRWNRRAIVVFFLVT